MEESKLKRGRKPKAKPITMEIMPEDIDFFGAVLNCAVRYSLGRASYMPGLVTDWIMQHCDWLLTEKTLFVMKRDIDEARAHDGLGMDCDVLTWLKFREWLEGQEGKWEQRQK